VNPFRRKEPDPELDVVRDAFRRVTAELDAAQRVLLAAIPTSRDTGTPLADAIDGFLAGLSRAEAAMPSWRRARTEKLWQRCATALVEAHTEARRLRDDPKAASLDFEPLNARLSDVIAPLEEFADVAPELRRLR
jgi:hypothetical protein